MSAGQFINTFVKSVINPSQIYSIRVQPETITAEVTPATGAAVINTPDAGPPTETISASVGGSTRRRGFHVSVVYLSLTGTPPTGYSANSKTTIPAMNAVFLSAANTKGAVVSYLGTTWRVLGVRVEKSR